MEYRRFGRTELRMPVFSCGGMRFQQKWQDLPLEQIEAEKQANLEATVKRAVDAGINHIETARGYGSSERQLGQVLPKYAREKLIVQTKIGPDADSEKFVRNFHESLDRMNMEYVDLLAIHGINDYQTLHWSIRKGGCLEAARKLQKKGLVRHVGFSTHGGCEQICDTVATEAFGGFDYVNLHWYYIYQWNWRAIEMARERDMGVFIISPSDKGGMLYKPSEKLVELTKPLHPIVFNDLFCLSHEEVHTLSVGASRPEDFELHLETLGYMDKAEEVLKPIVGRLEEAMAEAVGAEFAKGFDQGLRDWYHTPHYMNVMMIVWLRNLAKAYDMVEYGKMRYNLLGNGGNWFPGGNATAIDYVEAEKFAGNSAFKEEVIEALQEAREMLGGAEVKRLSQS